ncbi:MAG TPA: hypothetical protein VKS21_01105, partial [Spirochaetota bacterium]|nr:hypothetical protein [Spirochaetota bacterium]
ELGKLLGARLFITGSYGLIMEQNVISVNVVEVQTSQILFSESARCKNIMDLEKVINKLAGQIAEKAELFLQKKQKQPAQ